MVRLDTLSGDGLFVSHRNTFMDAQGAGPMPDSDASDVLSRARNMFIKSSEEPDSRLEPISDSDTGVETPDTAAQLTQLDAQVERMNDRFEQMEFTFAETGNLISDLRDELTRVAGQISCVNMPQIVDVLSQIRDSHAATLAAVSAPQEPVPDPMIATLVEEMRAMRSDLSRHAELAQAVDARLEDLAQQVATASATPDQTVTLLDHLTTRLDAVNAVVSRIAADQDDMAQTLADTPVPAALSALAEEMNTRLDAVDATVAQVAGDQVRAAQVLAETTLPEALSGLRADVALLAERGEPELDLTAQREGFEQFNQSAASFLRRMECLAATMASDHVRHLQTADAEISKRDSDAEELAEALRQLSKANTSLTGLLRQDAPVSKPALPHATQKVESE